MARGKKVELNLEEVQQLRAQGMSAAEIARRLGIPVSTLKGRVQQAQALAVIDVHKRPPVRSSSGATEVHKGSPTNVHIDIPLADLTDFHEMLAWWRKRKHLLARANEAPAPTERWTLHIEKPFIQRIKDEADAEHVTVTEVINRIIRHYYQGG